MGQLGYEGAYGPCALVENKHVKTDKTLNPDILSKIFFCTCLRVVFQVFSRGECLKLSIKISPLWKVKIRTEPKKMN
ncbi:MAG: hypothetical protein CSB47_04565 [Proteobacteria bacterium]|nr:MAG: hypothetical protein CSB47_04565 [Pseudomonadota bacterium]